MPESPDVQPSGQTRAADLRAGGPVLLIEGDLIRDCNEAAVAFFGAESRDDLLVLTIAAVSASVQVCGDAPEPALVAAVAATPDSGAHRFRWRFVTTTDEREVAAALTVLRRGPVPLLALSFAAGGNAEPVAAASPAAEAMLRVLVVEDNAVNLAVVTSLLRRLGCAVATAVNGVEALDSLASTPCDLVVMDCMMPVMDGYETARAIRAGRDGVPDPGVPIVALTANAQPGERERCLDAGMDDYLTKPVSRAALQDMLARHGGRGPQPDQG